jgi:hypothetical protein
MSRRRSYDRHPSGGGLMPRVLLVVVLLAGLVLAVRGALRSGGAPAITIDPSAKAIGRARR